jgi:hypothetical protein
MNTYTISAINNDGATTSAGIDFDHPNGGKEFTSVSAAVRAARNELGKGWRVSINDKDGVTVKEFTIKKD